MHSSSARAMVQAQAVAAVILESTRRGCRHAGNTPASCHAGVKVRSAPSRSRGRAQRAFRRVGRF